MKLNRADCYILMSGGEGRREIDFVFVSWTATREAMKTFHGMKIGGDSIKMDGLNSL
jgi:hypothetical protein